MRRTLAVLMSSDVQVRGKILRALATALVEVFSNADLDRLSVIGSDYRDRRVDLPKVDCLETRGLKNHRC